MATNTQSASNQEKHANGDETSGSDSGAHGTICGICWHTIDRSNRIRLIPCNHDRFCKDCIFKLFREKVSCPQCGERVAAVNTQGKILLTEGYDLGFDMIEAP
jgi:hypothetical protein